MAGACFRDGMLSGFAKPAAAEMNNLHLKGNPAGCPGDPVYRWILPVKSHTGWTPFGHTICGSNALALRHSNGIQRNTGAKLHQGNPGQCNPRAGERRGDELWKVDQVGGAVSALFLEPLRMIFRVLAPSLPGNTCFLSIDSSGAGVVLILLA